MTDDGMKAWVTYDDDDFVYIAATIDAGTSVTVYEVPYDNRQSTQSGGLGAKATAAQLAKEMIAKRTG